MKDEEIIINVRNSNGALELSTRGSDLKKIPNDEIFERGF
jgi:hypothetical protein